MALTFYQFSFLSLQSERAQIMLPLYLRGLAMGILFPPLTTIAISEVANQKMAQASGLINVIRQIGGSVGVALFGTILVRRTTYHLAMYGQQLDAQSPVVKQTLARLQHFAVHTTGTTSAHAGTQAGVLLGSFVGQQAFVSAVDDVFLVAGGILIVSAIPIIFLRSHRRRLRHAAAPAHAAEKEQVAP
jgi:DHA2 family multidrug resistance protein